MAKIMTNVKLYDKKGVKMSEWYDRFKAVRLAKDLSHYDVSRHFETDPSVISRYEAGKTQKLTRNLQRKLEGLFSDDEIAYIKGDIDSCPTVINDGTTHKQVDNSFVQEDGIMYGAKQYIEIPYYKDVYASAGGGSDRTDGSVRSPVSFSRAFLNSYLGVYNLNGISIINAAGDSMEPTIKSGELMFVSSMELEEFKDGGIYVIMCGDVLMVKRVTYDPLTGEYTLVSDNGKVAPVKLRMDEADGCRFVGRVVGHMDRV